MGSTFNVNFIDDIRDFHVKFDLSPTGDPGHRLPDDTQAFRLKFLLEELIEYAESVGYELKFGTTSDFTFEKVSNRFDAETALDGLVDLAYVMFGTAYLHRFPFTEAWARVQEANMKKMKALSADHSKRGYAADIVKPMGWRPPVLSDLVNPLRPVLTEVQHFFNIKPFRNLNMLMIADTEEDAALIRSEISLTCGTESHRSEVITKGQGPQKRYYSVVFMCSPVHIDPATSEWFEKIVLDRLDENGILYLLDGDFFKEELFYNV